MNNKLTYTNAKEENLRRNWCRRKRNKPPEGF
jgi:hypothetical protein